MSGDKDSRIPPAVAHTPECPCCEGDTFYDYGDYGYYCGDCRLNFDSDTLAASYSNPDAEPCGHPCDNGWHLPGAIPGFAFICHPCALPTGHDSRHWTGCERVIA